MTGNAWSAADPQELGFDLSLVMEEGENHVVDNSSDSSGPMVAGLFAPCRGRSHTHSAGGCSNSADLQPAVRQKGLGLNGDIVGD